MPIILLWNTLAFPQLPLFRRLLSDLNIASLSLEAGLKRRFDDADRAERLTSAYPVFRFTDEALSAFVTRNQYGQALSGPTPGWADRLAGLGRAWNLPRTIGFRIREAQLLPRLLSVVRQAIAAVGASVRRFEKPFSGMFSEGAVSAVDLFGMGALAFRSLGAGRAGLYVRIKALHEGLDAPSAVVTAGVGGSGAALPDLPLGDQIDEATRYVAGALILLPAISALMLDLGPDLIAGIKHITIENLVGIEAQVFDLRASFLAALSRGFAAYAQATVGFMLVVRDYALAHLDHWVAFAGAYLDGLHGGLITFVNEFGTFWGGVHTLITVMIGYGDQILAIDLTELIHRTLIAFQYLADFIIHMIYDKDEKPQRYVAPASFPVTFGQLVLGDGNGLRARTEVARGAGRVRELAGGSLVVLLGGSIGLDQMGINFAGLLNGVDTLGLRLNRTVRPLDPQPLLRYTDAAEPDLVALIVRPARDGIRDIVNNLGNSANTALQTTATGLTTMLDSAATEFDRAGASAARSGLGRTFGRIARQAETIAAAVFPLEQRTPSEFEPLAQQFAVAISGGFRAMEGVIGGYLGFVLQEWRTHLDANADTPVEVNAASPRILLQRARLGRVHMPEMVMRLDGHEFSERTAALVARRFAAEIRAAYLRGQARLDSWRDAAPTAPQ